ncbi:PLP-dependent transferase [Melanogaster broomeanus]|nr:PLP-dependent transferase [Melanogaster broomeanus]
MSSLPEKLTAALKSRDHRFIRRRLPEPTPTVHTEIDFTSNDYLSLSTSTALRDSVLATLSTARQILGSGGSRLLVPAPPHAALEARLCRFLRSEAALLFNSGFDANVGFFSSVPQPGDAILYDAHIHASVHDGMRLSRLTRDSFVSFAHNSVPALRRALGRLIRERIDLREGRSSIFVAVESLYSMDGTIAPLLDVVECVEEMLPLGNGYVVVDEAHATGIYGPKGRGLVIALGLEKRVFARLHTFGKSLGSSGAVLLTTELVKDYLLNYARSLVYTTTLTYANVIAVNCSFDMLEDGTTEVLSKHLLDLCRYFVDLLRPQLRKYPSSLLNPRALSTFLLSYTPTSHSPPPPAASASPSSSLSSSSPRPKIILHTKPIYPPTVPSGTSRVRICLHAAHTREDVALLVQGIVAWAEEKMREDGRERELWEGVVRGIGMGVWMEAKL